MEFCDVPEMKMESSGIICVEVQENENGEIIYVEKVENEDYVMNDDFCVVECEIATSSENTTRGNTDSLQYCNSSEPVEIIFLRNFGGDADGNPIVLKQEIESNENELDGYSGKVNVDNNIKTYVNKHQNFVKLEPISKDKYENFHNPKKHYAVKSAQAQKLNALLQVASGKVSQMSKSQESKQEQKVRNKQPNNNSNIHLRRLNTFSDYRPKLWSHRVDRRNFDKDGLLSNITNMACQKRTQEILPLSKEVFIKKEVCNTGTGISRFKVNSIKVQTAVRNRVRDLPYQCEMCEKSFRQASSLVIHLKVHAGKYADNCVIS